MTLLNSRLIEQQGLSSDDVSELEYLHETRELLFKQAEILDPNYAPDLQQLQLYADLLESLEFNMQRVWKFKQDARFHTWWFRFPHCACPKLDNADPLYSVRGRVISGECKIHRGRA